MEERIILIVVLILFALFLFLIALYLFYLSFNSFRDVFLTRYGNDSINTEGTIIDVKWLGRMRSSRIYPVIQYSYEGELCTITEMVHGYCYLKKDIGKTVSIFVNPHNRFIVIDYKKVDLRIWKFLGLLIAGIVMCVFCILVLVCVKEGYYMYIGLR